MLVLIGQGEQRQELEELALRCRADAQFIGVLQHDHIPIEINRSEVFILPSLFEGHPKALIEAMACGVPTISTKRNIKKGEFEKELDDSIIVVSPNDPIGLSEAINYLLENPKIAKEIGNNGRNIVINNYTWDKSAKKVQDVYKYAIENHKKRF